MRATASQHRLADLCGWCGAGRSANRVEMAQGLRVRADLAAFAVGEAVLAAEPAQRSGLDVGVVALLVRVGVVPVVLVHPPTETQPDRQVAIQQSDDVVGPRRSGDLSVPGLVADEAELGVD